MENTSRLFGKPIIQMREVSKIYTMGSQQLRALDRVSLTIWEGEFVSIIGPSGSGKSTLMNIMGCLDEADEGEYFLNGKNIKSYSEKQLSSIRSRQIGFVFQGFNLLPRLSCADNVELPLIYQRIPTAERKHRVSEALRCVGLENRADHKPSEISGGQQQRVAIARALVTNPSLILGDEPTGNLDSKTGEEIMELFRSLNSNGNTIVLITHDNGVAAQAKRRIRIRDGRATEVSE